MLFLIANNLKGWSLQKIVRKTLPLYALGMRLRVFPQSTLLAILSGPFSGLGASLTLLVIRTWLYALSDRDPTEKEQLIYASPSLFVRCHSAFWWGRSLLRSWSDSLYDDVSDKRF